MIRKIAFILTLFYGVSSFSQHKYPQNYFQNPLDIPLILAGTFGELRSNHFHSGIDIKTQKREGLKVFAVADGYVSRIKIRHWGFGKALYVTHPNGYTTVYAHLKKFSPEIEAYIKKQQYAKESYEIQLFLGENTLKVKKGGIIAFSGNTGGSSGAHLHFEIRSTKTEKTINPMLFGIHVNDSVKPVIASAYVYPIGKNALVNQFHKKQKIQFTRLKNGDLKSDKVIASGDIGIGVKSFDRLDAAMNKNGLYKLELFVNNQKVYQHTLESFSFSESKYINLLIDYPHKYRHRERIQKCFVVPNNRLSIYDELVNKGIISIEDGMNYTIKVIASDLEGNTTKLIIPIVGKLQKEIPTKADKETSHHFKRVEFNSIKKGNISLSIPKYSFYEDTNIDFSYTNGIVKIHNPSVPLHKSFNLTFYISKYPVKERHQLFIARLSKKGHPKYVYTKRKDGKLYINTKTFGNYKLASDTKKPTITPKNFKDEQWLSNYRYLKVRIKDDLSGIKKYRATIDGKWILMEYEPKTGMLIFDFNDRKFRTAKHTLKIVVSDNVKNTKTYIATFYRKK
jgi:murein DD-endopeptidase MepM/ murein hydrolase activator NlpD